MGTVIRAEVSIKNKYWIDKHRHYELKHFCLQYPLWKKAYLEFSDVSIPLSMINGINTSNLHGDPTAKRAIMRAYYLEKIELIERIAKEADRYLWTYIVKAVTEGLSYTHLKSKLDIPCSKDMYYDRYRKFFWLLSKARK
ncbi:MAG: hypothetical protein IKU29_05080 [Parabacteroides sp.]|nr:hypothetical protein [Parabacteroides sp.]